MVTKLRLPSMSPPHSPLSQAPQARKAAKKWSPLLLSNSKRCLLSTWLNNNISPANSNSRCPSSPSGSPDQNFPSSCINKISRTPRCSQQPQRLAYLSSRSLVASYITHFRNSKSPRQRPQRQPNSIITRMRTRVSGRTTRGRLHMRAGVPDAPRALIASSPSMTMMRKKSELEAAFERVTTATILL